jgi:hypothetical protein
MSTNTRTQKFAPAPAQFEAGLVWDGDMPTWPTTQAPAPTQVTIPAGMVAVAEGTQVVPVEMFQASGAELRKIAYTPTGRTRTTPEAQAALGEIARRAARKAARKAAR